MRPGIAPVILALAFTLMPMASRSAPLADTLAGNWTCLVREGGRDVSLTASYLYGGTWLYGEIEQDRGASLLDLWFDDGEALLVLRRILSDDATIGMKLVDESPDSLVFEGGLLHVDGLNRRVREEFRFSGSDEFRAIWEDDSGGGWRVVLDRTCRRM